MTTVLIVDDELDMRLLVRMILQLANNGFEVVGEASDGDEALDLWRELSGPPPPDVVVLDNRMPHLTGLEAARKIMGERPDQVVILYSAFLDDSVRAEARELGISACVTKYDIQELPDLIRSLIPA